MNEQGMAPAAANWSQILLITLVADEIEREKLFQLSPIELNEYGYFLACTKSATRNPEAQAFIEWIKAVAE